MYVVGQVAFLKYKMHSLDKNTLFKIQLFLCILISFWLYFEMLPKIFYKMLEVYLFICIRFSLSHGIFSGNSEINFVHWMRLQKDITTRCKCGHFFKVVDYDTFYKSEDEYMRSRFEKVKDNADMQVFLKEVDKRKEVMDQLYTKLESVDRKSDEGQAILDEMYQVDSRVKELEKEMISKYFG